MKRTALKRKIPMKRTGFKQKFKTGDGVTITLRQVRKPMRRKQRDYATKKADKLWATIIHARGMCAMCRIPNASRMETLEAHHARGRSKAFRWRTDLGLLLCAYHHRHSTHSSAHGAPAGFRKWLTRTHPDILSAKYEPETAAQAIERLKRELKKCLTKW